MKVVRLKTFAEPLAYQRCRDRKLRYQVHTHSVWTQLGYAITVHIENERLPGSVARVAVLRANRLRLV